MNGNSKANDIAELQEALIKKLTDAGCIRSPGVERAFRAVQRHLFLPGIATERAYSDQAILTKRLDGKAVSSSSQPAIMAIMLEQLQLQPGHHVMEIGTGTGYNAGLMRHLVGNTGAVVTVDIDEDLVASARDHLRATDLDGVRVVCGDGGLGYADGAPYDRIILTVGAWDIVPVWWRQLKPGGRLVLPLEIKDGIQKSIAFDNMDGYLESVSVVDCGFMTLRGAFAKPQNTISVSDEPGLSIVIDHGTKVDGKAVYSMLSGPSEDVPLGIQASPAEVIFGGLSLWLSLRESGLCTLLAEGQAVDRGMVPRFMAMSGEWKRVWTGGLLGDEELCVFVRPPGHDASSEQMDDSRPAELFVRSYGEGTKLAKRLVYLTRAWDAAGRPSSKGLLVRAYPKDADFVPSTDEFVINKEWSRLVLWWE
jgi:protein-L-isoaspartate(D-aspartate) O-methyltransferase